MDMAHRLWGPTFNAAGFRSGTGNGCDEAATGKWLVPAASGDPEDLHGRLIVAAASGRLPAVKVSAPALEERLGHALACVYCFSSDRAAAAELLARLRSMGVEGDLAYKSDRATADGSDRILWRSCDLEMSAVERLVGAGSTKAGPAAP